MLILLKNTIYWFFSKILHIAPLSLKSELHSGSLKDTFGWCVLTLCHCFVWEGETIISAHTRSRDQNLSSRISLQIYKTELVRRLSRVICWDVGLDSNFLDALDSCYTQVICVWSMCVDVCPVSQTLYIWLVVNKNILIISTCSYSFPW